MNIYGYKLKTKKIKEDLRKKKIGPREAYRRLRRRRDNIRRLRQGRIKKEK